MLYYFAGEDSYEVRQAIEDICKREKAKIKWLDPEQAKVLPPREWTASGAGLFEKNIIVVRQAEALPVSVQQSVIDASQALAQSSVVVILWEGSSNKKNTLKRKLKAYAQEFSCLQLPGLVAWLTKKAEKRGSRLDRKAAEELISRVGDDRWVLLSELEKLTLQHEVITPDHIKKELPEHLETTVFVMLDAVVRGNSAGVARSVETLLHSGAGELYILSMLAYQFRTLLQIRQGKNMEELKPYVIQKNRPIAQRFSSSQLLDILTRVLATDFAIKQGTVEPRTAVWLLLTTLTAQMQQKSMVRAS